MSACNLNDKKIQIFACGIWGLLTLKTNVFNLITHSPQSEKES